jgi:hypothetical protein
VIQSIYIYAFTCFSQLTIFRRLPKRVIKPSEDGQLIKTCKGINIYELNHTGLCYQLLFYNLQRCQVTKTQCYLHDRSVVQVFLDLCSGFVWIKCCRVKLHLLNTFSPHTCHSSFSNQFKLVDDIKMKLHFLYLHMMRSTCTV